MLRNSPEPQRSNFATSPAFKQNARAAIGHAGLQKALARHLAETICASIEDAVLATRAGEGSPRDVVDLTFDAFDKEGGGALASWMLLSGNEDALDPIVEAIHDMVDKVNGHDEEPMHEVTLSLVLMALGDALMGAQLAQSLMVDRRTTRDHATAMIAASLVKAGNGKG